MRLAIISDIHANLPALEAVYAHALKQNVEDIYCLGDLVNQNVWNNETVDFIRSRNIQCVRGNHDEGIGNNKKKFPFSYGSREEEKWGAEAIQYTLDNIIDGNKAFLQSLPYNIRINVTTCGQARSIVLAHGTPKSNQKRIYRFYKDEDMLHIMEDADADVLLIGNTHASFHKILERVIDDKPCYRHIINPGSVGYPRDGSWHACYAILHIDDQSDLRYNTGAVKVDFYRLDYDINKVIKAIQKSPLHIYYAMRLLKY